MGVLLQAEANQPSVMSSKTPTMLVSSADERLRKQLIGILPYCQLLFETNVIQVENERGVAWADFVNIPVTDPDKATNDVA